MGEPTPGPSVGTSRRARVAITRSVDDNRSLADRLRQLGFEVVAQPLIEVIEPADGGAALRLALADLSAIDWVVLTSANGVRALVDAGLPRPWPDEVRVAAVGPVTAAAARAAGVPVTLVPAVATAEALVEAFPSAGAGPPGRGRALAPLAELASDTVVAGLAAKGWHVDRVEAYRTIDPLGPGADGPPDDPGFLDAVTFFSPSAVDRWVDRHGPTLALAICVGPSTAARARARVRSADGNGDGVVIMADPHTEDGVVAAVEAALAGRR